ncbi:hypothetical protein [Occultella gossypii]|uniref:Nucleotidyl transferase AbiEii toxin, Type IV TA system n=1 Tax=Occultella gossypii TaxID=2800820 RepID=A0ABS7SC19_9MICO|nr:hypothetical protein [Occultella gossypii]MBZ2197901.1 hypothetical protein [Occultella gossypii]
MSVIPVRSPSAATDAAWLAAADIATIASTLEVKYRLVGGIAVTLLTHRYGVQDQVDARETADADMGVPKEVCGDDRLPAALLGLGYKREGGNRFVRSDGDRNRTIDVLAPSPTVHLESNQPVGELSVDLIPGLTTALRLDPVQVSINAQLQDGSSVTMTLDLPHLIGALTLKAFAFKGRLQTSDAIDIWRLLVAADAAGITAADWPSTGDGKHAGALLHEHFGRTNAIAVRRALPRPADQANLRLLLRDVVADARI